MWRFVLGLFVLIGMAGCATAPPPGPLTITFDAEGFLTIYMADRDEVIVQTAAGVLRCRRVTEEAPVQERTRCNKIRETQTDWKTRDKIVYTALVKREPIRGIDWEKAAEAAAKFIGTAIGAATEGPKPSGIAPAAGQAEDWTTTTLIPPRIGMSFMRFTVGGNGPPVLLDAEQPRRVVHSDVVEGVTLEQVRAILARPGAFESGVRLDPRSFQTPTLSER